MSQVESEWEQQWAKTKAVKELFGESEQLLNLLRSKSSTVNEPSDEAITEWLKRIKSKRHH
jgi:hypothetical protein